MTRALLVLGSLLCVFFLSFKMYAFLGAGFSCFHTFYLLGALSALNLSAEGAGVLPSSPTFGPGRQTGTG